MALPASLPLSPKLLPPGELPKMLSPILLRLLFNSVTLVESDLDVEFFDLSFNILSRVSMTLEMEEELPAEKDLEVRVWVVAMTLIRGDTLPTPKDSSVIVRPGPSFSWDEGMDVADVDGTVETTGGAYDTPKFGTTQKGQEEGVLGGDSGRLI